MNSVVLVGRMTATPELRKTNSNVSVTSFGVAVDRRFRDQNGERGVDFINCVAWRQTAEFICQYFEKGQRIGLAGSIQTRQYTDRDGNKRTAVEVVVDQAEFVERKRDSGEAGGNYAPRSEAPAAAPAPTPSYNNAAPGDFSEIVEDDELPF